jgi:hypothetical protein
MFLHQWRPTIQEFATFSKKRLGMLNDGIFGVAMRGSFSTHAYRMRMTAATRYPVLPA